MSVKSINIINDAKQEYARTQVILKANNNKEYEVLIQENLNETTIATIVAELAEYSAKCKENGIDFNITLITYMLLIKHFTDIKFNTYTQFTKQLSHNLQLLNALIDLGLFEQILNKFNDDSKSKILEIFDKYSEQMNRLISTITEKEVLDNDNA